MILTSASGDLRHPLKEHKTLDTLEDITVQALHARYATVLHHL